MKKVYLHGEGIKETRLVELPANAKKEMLTAAAEKESNTIQKDDKVYFFLDDGEEPVDESEVTLENKQHVHAHRCKKVRISVSYNGIAVLNVPPNTKVSKLIRMAAKELGISDVDAADLLVKLGETTLESTDRIGTFVPHDTCSLSVFLTPNPQVKG